MASSRSKPTHVLVVVLVAMLILESFVPKMQRLQDALIPQATGNALLDIVNQSPIAVRARSKQQWLNAFSENATVQDPTGSQTHTGVDSFALFHKALIEPHSIAFDVKRDFVDWKAHKVTRLCDIHITFYNNVLGLGQIQPAHLVYDIDPQSLKITALRANWEVVQSVAMGNSLLEKLVTYPVVFAGFFPVLSTFGWSFTLEYLASFLIGPLTSGGKELVGELFEQQDGNAFVALFEPEAKVEFQGEMVDPVALWQYWDKDTTQVRLIGQSVTSGLRTAARFERTTTGKVQKHGVLHFESQKPAGYFSSARIKRMYLYEED